MSRRLPWPARGGPAWRWGVGGLAALAALTLAQPSWPFYLVYMQVPLALAVAFAGWYPRRSWADALWLAVPVLAAHLVEPHVGAWAIACLMLPWYALTGRPRFSAGLGCSLLALLVAAIHLKVRFAGTRLTWQDIHFFFAQFGDNVGVFATQPTLLLYAALVLALLAAILYAAWRLDRPARGSAGPHSRAVAVTLVLSLALWSGMEIAAEAQQVVAMRTAWGIAEIEGASEVPISRFLATALMQPEWVVPAADTGAFRDAARRGPPPASAQRADIVMFLQESQFNPATWKDCPPALCRLPVFEPSRETVALGPLRVHVFGGGTWLSEFTAATGIPHVAFGQAAGFAPFNVAPAVRRSFIRSLKAAGYRAVAVYPVRGGMMNARNAYAAYGFDAFYDAQDLGLPGNFQTPDAMLHAAAMRVLEQERRHGQPLLLWTVTIANHGEHGMHMDGVPADLVAQARASFPEGREAENVADYVWRTRQFQEVLASTRKKVLGGPRPAIVAWFGDHQPPFGSAVSLRARVEPAPVPGNSIPASFQTWYEISSNLPGKVPARLAPLDIAFLPGMLAQAAGVPQDEWLAANVAAREQCGGLLAECARPQVRDAYLTYLRQDLKAIALP